MGCVIYELATLQPPFLAKDMKTLYNRVIKGVYPKLPKHYSSDLSNMIDHLLSVDPIVRPSAEDVMSMTVFQKRHIDIQIDQEDSEDELLGTIRLPKNLKQLTERLPSSQYGSRRRKSKLSQNNGTVNNVMSSDEAATTNSDSNSSRNSNMPSYRKLKTTD